ncbi:MAG: sensor histidine kinase, partial [Gemmatimonadota bacterium]|nr:sensor histidine kinase [Gemmatimonadota bacterium]
FTPEGGSIYFRAWGEPGWLIFQIRDTGQGIPSAQLPYVFEKYYQAGRHAGKVGAGLGLAIAREIAEAHGGRISAESEEGVGSVFRVELPVLAQSASPDAPSHRVYGSDGETEDEAPPASGGGAIPSRVALGASERG